MVELLPTRAFHPDPRRVNPDQVVCPVYDTLSETELSHYSEGPFNAARFVPRPKSQPLTTFLTLAKKNLFDAIDERAYVRDERGAFYVYGIQYVPPPDIFETIASDQRRERYLLLGLVGDLDISAPEGGQIAPHERTFADRVEERRALTEATGMSFAPILAGYHRPDHRLNDRLEQLLGLNRRRLTFTGSVPPVVEANLLGSVHRLWRIDDERLVDEIAREVRPYRVVILDGHHRFAAAQARRRAGRPSTPLTMLVDGHDRALQLLPWHRVLPGSVAPFDELVAAAKREFPHVMEAGTHPSVPAVLERLQSMHRRRHRGFLAANRDRLFEVVGPTSEDGGADFDLLHDFLDRKLGIDPHSLEFVRSPRKVLERLKEPDGAGGPTAFMLPALSARAVEERAFEHRAVMAEKSTMFLPKVAEGMLFAPADGPD